MTGGISPTVYDIEHRHVQSQQRWPSEDQKMVVNAGNHEHEDQACKAPSFIDPVVVLIKERESFSTFRSGWRPRTAVGRPGRLRSAAARTA